MKAAVLPALGAVPQYQDFPVPTPQNDQQELLRVTAASIKNLDKGRASGQHYASYQELPVVVGIDGVGRLADGTRVYAQGLTGMLAEQALVTRGQYVPLPPGLDDATAAALPNAAAGAALALRFRGDLQPGDTVLVNGATGVTGLLAVQLARHYGAGRIIATGRNADSLARARELGADVTVSLAQDEAVVVEQLRAVQAATPIGLVVDYLWGRPVELLLSALQGRGLHALSHPLRLVTVGSMAGETIGLSSGILRSAPIELRGSGLGSVSAGQMRQFGTEILPELFELAAAGRLHLATETHPLAEVATAWTREPAPGTRLVVRM